MKRILLLSVFTAIAISGSAAEFFSDPGFESDHPGTSPKEWSLWAREKGAAQADVTETANTGKHAVRIQSSSSRDWSFTTRKRFAVNAGDTLSLGCHFRNHVEKTPNLSLQVSFYRDEQVINYQGAALPIEDLGADWRSFTLNFTIPEKVNRIAVRLAGNGACDFFADDFVLAPAAIAPATLIDADFRSDSVNSVPRSWSAWARQGVTLTVKTVEGKDAKWAEIRAAGERDWAFSLKQSTPVEAGQFLRFSCRARNLAALSGSVSLQLTGSKAGKVVYYNFASLDLKELSGAWQEFSAEEATPPDIDAVSIRLSGEGNCNLAVEHFRVETVPGKKLAPLPEQTSRKVEGWATQRIKESLNRGLIAFPQKDGSVYLSWRLLEEDPAESAFDLFFLKDGKEKKLNPSPISQTTDYWLAKADSAADEYIVRPANFTGKEGRAKLHDETYERNPFRRYKLADSSARVDKIGIGDLDGDGEYDFVVRYGCEGVDPYHHYWKPSRKPLTLAAIKSDGTVLWTKSLGMNIESGIWYSPFIVWDVNDDGRAEVILKASDPAEGDMREKSGPDQGKVLKATEFLMVLDGMTGREIARAPWPDRRYFFGRGTPYNYYSRNQLTIAYLDGKTPCIVVPRGTYDVMIAEAWQLNGDKLEKLWGYNSTGYGREYRGQGAHTTRTLDVDGDGRDEIVLGGAVLDDDGSPLWSTGLGHPDFVYVTDITPSNPGLEIVSIYETACPEGGGFTCADAKTGRILWRLKEPTTHIHYGYGGDIDGRYRGWETGGSDTVGGDAKTSAISRHYSPDGELLLSDKDAPYTDSRHFAYWDADLQRELAEPVMSDYRGGPSGGGFEGKFLMQADLYGDWREEIITVFNGEFRIYSTLVPAMDRRVTLMQDPAYRQTIAANAVGYLYDPGLSYLPTSVSPNLNLTWRKEASELEVTVSAPLDRGLGGVLKLFPEKGTLPEKTQLPIRLQPGDLTTLSVKLRNLPSSPALIRAELMLDDGTLLKGQVPIGEENTGARRPSGIVVEAEQFTAETGGQVRIRDDKKGVSAKSISHWDKEGHSLSWQLTVPESGLYRFQLRYSTDQGAKREAVIDGRSLGVFFIPGTGGFGSNAFDWQDFTLPPELALPKGNSIFTLKGIDGSLNLDYIELIRAIPATR